MAKNNDDDSEQKIDEESLQFLEQVRKGKARNFVMSVKGAKVKSLLVKKKKIKEKEIKEARGGGFQPMYGVLEGQGNNITFNIALSDGFEKDPMGGKVAKLKEFLKSQTGKAFKPTVQVVSNPPPIPFDDDDLQNPLIARFVRLKEQADAVIKNQPQAQEELGTLVSETHSLLQDDETSNAAEPKIVELENRLNQYDVTASQPQESEKSAESEVQSAPAESQQDDSPQQPPERSVLASKLAEGLKKLKPAVQSAIQTAPDQKQVLMTSMAQVVSDIKAEKLDDAKVNMVTLGKLIQEIRASGGGPQPAQTESQVPDPTLGAKLGEALKKLKPAADKIIEVMPDKKSELYGEIAKIAGQIKGKEYETAKQSIAEFAPTLKTLQQQAVESSMSQENTTESTTGESTDPLGEFYARKYKLEEKFLEACRADFERKSKLQIDWNATEIHAEKQEFETAHSILDRLERNIQEILSGSDKSNAAGIEKGLVEKRQFMLGRLKQIPVEVKPHLESVKAKIIDENADGNPAELVSLLETALQEFYDEIQDEIDDSINAGDSSKIAGLKNRVTANPLVSHLVSNPFTDGTRFQSAILDALDEIEQKLAG